MVVVVWIARSVELPCQLFPLLFEAMFDAAAAAGTVEAVLATSAVGIEAGAEASQFAPPYYTAAFPSLLGSSSKVHSVHSSLSIVPVALRRILLTE